MTGPEPPTSETQPSDVILPPYGEMVRQLNKGRLIPFLGAGVNSGNRPPKTPWDKKSPFPPRGDELSLFLAKLINFPSLDDGDRKDLAKVASYYVETSARYNLLETLHEIFCGSFAACSIHTYLAEIETPLLIVVTNYDDLTEQAFKAKGRAYDLIVHLTDHPANADSVLYWKHGEPTPEMVDPCSLAVDLASRTVIYKMHGTVVREPFKPEETAAPAPAETHNPFENDSYVISEEDYIDFLSRMTGNSPIVPRVITEHFMGRQFLFLGYGLRDWNLRVVLRNLRKPKGKEGAARRWAERAMSYAIQHNPSELEKRLWQARNVLIFNQDIESFVDGLRANV